MAWLGRHDIIGSRDAINLAFKAGIISDGLVWLDMLKSRNLSSHIYNEPVADKVFSDIKRAYYPQFIALKATLENL